MKEASHFWTVDWGLGWCKESVMEPFPLLTNTHVSLFFRNFVCVCKTLFHSQVLVAVIEGA